MANKVQYGLSNVHVAFLTEATGVYATPIAVPGAIKLSLTPEGDETEFYADNIAYFTATSNQGYKGDLEMALVPDAVLAEMLGWDTDDSGMLVELADGLQKPFALMGEVDGDANKRRFTFYSCKAARPSADHGTKSKSLEPASQVLSLTVSPREIGEQLVVKATIERSANASVYDAWYTAVDEPSFAVVS